MLNFTRKPSAHLSDIQLLEYIDGELPEAEATAAGVHINTCSSCRIRVERYTLCRRSVELYHSSALARLGAPPTRFANFYQRLVAQKQEWRWRKNHPAPRRVARALVEHLAALGRWWADTRPALRAAPAIVAAAIVAILLLRPSTKVSATELLDRAQAAEDSSMARVADPVEHQRIRVHARGQQSELEIWHSRHERRLRLVRTADEPMRALLDSLYRSNSLDPERPLAVADFIAWRSALPRHEDRVREDTARHLVQITTTAPNAGPGHIQHIDCVLRTTDWHPVEQHIYVNRPGGAEEEFDLEEISYAVVPEAQIPANLFAASAAVPEPASTTDRSALQAPATEARLMASMVVLAETFHRIGADLREAPDVRIEGDQVEYDLWTADPVRREQILDATRAIPFVAAHIEVPRAPVAHALPLPAEQPTYTTAPPLQRELWKFAGGAEEGSNYLTAMSDAEHRLLNESAALDRLAVQFPQRQIDQLPPNLQHAVQQIAFDHLHAIRSNATEYFSLLNPLLDAMRRKEGMADTESDRAPDCADWQTLAPRLHKNLPLLHVTIERAFVEDRVDSPAEDLSAQTLLNQAAQLRAHVRANLAQSCGESVQSTPATPRKELDEK